MISCTLPRALAVGASASVAVSSVPSSCKPQSRAINFRITPKPKFLHLSRTAYLLNFRIGRYSSVVVSSTLNEVNESSQWCHQAMKAASIALYALVVLHYSVYLLCSKIAGDSSNITERTEQFEEHVKSFPTRLEVATDFIIQVSNLVELVDSRDIIKFQIKHQDFEIIIRKKEELPAIMMESNSQLL